MKVAPESAIKFYVYEIFKKCDCSYKV
ncbi:hypothetical protein RDI58_029292 [Solanum bulbocastanum]|uniref:Uncharacterized protein n=1 Tax=Solanum bulbocastanum TaxID=147425 RepID=A0AAN8SX78_SOLBU